MEEILTKKKNEQMILLGNEAVARGALEVGVQFITTYPGTPASEIGNTFYKLKTQKLELKNIHFEYSVNEKVALEAGVGASFCGLKTLVAMKHFGLNVAQEALIPFVYTGCIGPTVIVVAGDPSCHSSAQSEQNSRIISYLAHIPTLEPSDPQEARDFTILAFKISKRFKVPVMLRLTTRVSHQRAVVRSGELKAIKAFKGKFIKDPRKFITMPPRVLEMKKELLKKIGEIKEFTEKSKVNFILDPGSDDLGIVTSGISYLYVREALKRLRIKRPILKLGFFYPLSEKKIKAFLKNKKKILIVEELEPWLEKEVARLAKEVNCDLEIYGKDLLPIIGELRPETIFSSIAGLVGAKSEVQSFKLQVPRRSPQPCPGCPYWLVFGAVKQALRSRSGQAFYEKVVFGGDIGCYMLAGIPMLKLQDYLSCMGSSIGIGHGIKKSTNQKLIAFIGDSTFFHAGIPALINTVMNKSNPLIIIMDNQTTAMTGQQPNPGQIIKIENIAKACGVKNLKVIDPKEQKELINTIKNFLNKKEVSVIIARSPCIFIKYK